MRTEKHFVRLPSRLRGGILWVLDRLAAFFDRMAALMSVEALRLDISNTIIVFVYKEVSRDVELWVGETRNCVPRSRWSQFAADLAGIGEDEIYVILDRNGDRIAVTLLENDKVELRFHAIFIGGVVRVRRSDLAKSLAEYGKYVDAAAKS